MSTTYCDLHTTSALAPAPCGAARFPVAPTTTTIKTKITTG